MKADGFFRCRVVVKAFDLDLMAMIVFDPFGCIEKPRQASGYSLA